MQSFANVLCQTCALCSLSCRALLSWAALCWECSELCCSCCSLSHPTFTPAGVAAPSVLAEIRKHTSNQELRLYFNLSVAPQTSTKLFPISSGWNICWASNCSNFTASHLRSLLNGVIIPSLLPIEELSLSTDVTGGLDRLSCLMIPIFPLSIGILFLIYRRTKICPCNENVL